MFSNSALIVNSAPVYILKILEKPNKIDGAFSHKEVMFMTLKFKLILALINPLESKQINIAIQPEHCLKNPNFK